uniref:Uncharacterized protein n=1 Tax=viral metagenome TaxID=1070528 RepID=A0A6M3LC93_9ZZZZ
MKIEHELIHRIISSNHLVLIPNFYLGAFECDLFALNKMYNTTEYEIKRSRADFKNDFNKVRGGLFWKDSTKISNKHDQIRLGKRTNRFYFVIEKGLDVEIPDYAGLIEFEVRHTIIFRYIKRAPLLHRNKADQNLINSCLQGFTWRYYKITRQKLFS